MSLLKVLNLYEREFGLMLPINYRTMSCFVLDLSRHNLELKNVNFSDPKDFEKYILRKTKETGKVMAIGKYNEERALYDHCILFTGAERRDIHLGIDLWVPPETPILCPLDGKVHSFADNKGIGDYGPTIILEHELDKIKFYTLYGHLAEHSLDNLFIGKKFQKGEVLAWVGSYPTNGNWPPHLHFEIVKDMLGKKGDFFGVCSKSEREKFLEICPDPNLILQIPGLI